MIDSIKKLRLSPQEEQAYRVWIAARDKYRAESALFQRLNRQIPRALADRSAVQIVLHAQAKDRYKAACKEYYQAQAAYNASKSPLSTQEVSEMDAMRSAIEQFVQSLKKIQPSMVQVGAQAAEDEVLKARFGAVEQNPMLSAIAEAARARNAPEEELDFTEDLGDGSEAPEYEESSASPDSEESSTVVLSPEELIQRFGIPEKHPRSGQ